MKLPPSKKETASESTSGDRNRATLLTIGFPAETRNRVAPGLHVFIVTITLPKTNTSPLKMMVSKFGISFSSGLFSGAMLVLGRGTSENSFCGHLLAYFSGANLLLVSGRSQKTHGLQKGPFRSITKMKPFMKKTAIFK